MLQVRAFKVRLYPTPSQERAFELWLWRCRELYNACLQERRDAWKKCGVSLTRIDQQNELPAVKAACPEFSEVYAQVLQDVCGRIDKTFRAFFKRAQAGATPGFPRFKGRARYNSFTYPQAGGRGHKYSDKRILLPKIGHVRWKPWKSIEEMGRIKQATVKREADGWYVVLVCEQAVPEPFPSAGRTVGLDLGLRAFVTTSTGEVLGDLEPLKRAEHKLRKAQRVVSRRKKGSNQRKKAVRTLARRAQHLARLRAAQGHEISRKLVNAHDVICVEDLNIAGLAKAGAKNAQGRGLRRNIHHAAWSGLIQKLTYKAESAGRQLIKVDPRGTSQQCSRCGVTVQKDLSVRVHRCSCGLVLDRDHNAALNVLTRGLAITVPACLPGTGPSGRTHVENAPSGTSMKREDGMNWKVQIR